MLFMGQEWASRRPFLFFCDFAGELGDAVREGRRKEFAAFAAFADPEARARIPDPIDPATFAASGLDWAELAQPEPSRWLALHRELLRLRAAHIVPLLRTGHSTAAAEITGSLLAVDWDWPDGQRLSLTANLGDDAVAGATRTGEVIYCSPGAENRDDALPGWSVRWTCRAGEG